MDDDDTRDSFPSLVHALGGARAELYPDLRERLRAAERSTDPGIRRRLRALHRAIEARTARRSEQLTNVWKLTPTEARLAIHVADGGTVAGYAELFGVSVGTVRSQLKSVFAKTGVNRQSALAALIPRF